MEVDAKPKILVVDDEPDIVAVLREFLAEKGYEVIDALSGEQALAILDKQSADLVLMDLMMPGIKGTDAARIIKKKYPGIKIITLTAYPDMGDNLLRDNILDGVFIKPIRMQELVNQLINILGKDVVTEAISNEQKQPVEARAFLITAKLLFIESSLEVYDKLKLNFHQQSKKGQHYLIGVACNERQILDKLQKFNPDIVLINASFFKGHDRNIVSNVISRASESKEVLIYNVDETMKCDAEKIDRILKNVELTCFFKGYI